MTTTEGGGGPVLFFFFFFSPSSLSLSLSVSLNSLVANQNGNVAKPPNYIYTRCRQYILMCLSHNKYFLYRFLVVEKKTRKERKEKKVEVDITHYVRMHKNKNIVRYRYINSLKK